MTDQRTGFNFNRDFTKARSAGAFLDGRAALPVPHAEHVARLEQARRTAYEEGVAEGRDAQASMENKRLGDALDRIAAELPSIIHRMKDVEQQARGEAILFARLFAAQLAAGLVERAPMATIEATARAILDDLRGAAHVAVRVAPALVDPCKNRIGLLLREHGIEPKLFVFPDPDVAVGDCRIEWADGGIVRERDKLLMLIDKSIDMLLPRAS